MEKYGIAADEKTFDIWFVQI